MRLARSSRRAKIAAFLSAAVGLTGLQLSVAPIASAASSTLVINEIYVNGGSTNATYTNKYVEIRNLSGAAVNLAGKSVQYRAPGSTGSSTGRVDLAGSVAAGGYFVLVGASNNGAAPNGIPVPNQGQQSNSLNPGAGGGTLTLVEGTSNVDPSSSTAVIDKIGYGTSNTPEGGTPGATGNGLTQVIGRSGPSTDTDVNRTDFAAQDPTPGAANPGGGPAGLAVTDPGTQTAPVGEPIGGFTLTATGGTSPYTWTATGLPAGLTLAPTGEITGTPTTAGSTSVTVTVTDSASPAATAQTTFTFTVTSNAPLTIADVQGTGDATPLSGQTVTVPGVVTASFATGGLNGFYVQTPGPDTTPEASDGVFVYGGSSGFSTYPAVGDSVRVTGVANEFSGQTQITATNAGVTVLADSLGTVVPKTAVPGTDCALPGTACLTGAALNTARETVESEAFQPTADYTATDVYDGSPYNPNAANSSGNFGEIGLAAGSDVPLVAPTEVIDAQATADINARKAYNDAHRIVLDDGSSANYTAAANTASPFPWMTVDHSVRVGAAVSFPTPVVFTYGFNAWRLLPSTRVVGAPTATQPQIEQTRADNLAPQDVGGDVRLATFNVLNFFPTTGVDFVNSGLGSCTYYRDRDNALVTVNSCNNGNGPRGAADDANLVRQRDKIVSAINGSAADVVSLEELENSVKFGKDRDFAISALVEALNADAGAGTWAFVPSPAAAGLPATADQDVIRNGFIYKPVAISPVGDSVVLSSESGAGGAFEDAREPLAQAFKAAGSADADAFAVIVNHFKSKGSGTADPDGQGNANDRRVLQAQRLVTFADEFTELRDITRVFLAGDFNAYSQEDPIQVLNAAGYTNLESTSDPQEESYNFDGQVGSLDHVLANDAALADVAGVDIWQINAAESVYYEYSRFNYNVSNLYSDGPFRSSDHNPEVVGINAAAAPGGTVPVQILATNDFHGRIANDPSSSAAGAGVLAGAVKQLRGANPNTVFAAAGDLIGASTFESFIAQDKPTIDALNEAGLEVSAVGNHEFDQGYDDLVNRVMAPYDAQSNPYGGAEWKYIGANVKFKDDGSDALDGTWIKDMGGVQVGFVGAVTEHLDELVSPAGIEDIEATDIVEATNAAADDLKAEGADVVVLLVHEGASSTVCETMDDDPTSDFGSIVTGVNDNVDAIVSGHTHLAYNCSFPVAGWADRAVTERAVVSAGQYGSNLNQLVFDVDSATGEVTAKTQSLLALKTGQVANYPVDQPTQDIVAAAVANAEVLGAQPLGQIAAPFTRGFFAGGTAENRGAESTLGNLVAEVQQWATETPTAGSAQIAFMNPGGLRADLVGNAGTGASRTVTYKQAATVQPFANTLVNVKMTGVQVKAALEQQWQPAGSSRPFLRLGTSQGFTYSYDPTAAAGSHVTQMWLDGAPVDPAATYSVTVNSFLAAGGDNFGAFNVAANLKQDTGRTDLQAMVDYLEEFANVAEGDEPLPVDASQRSVGVTFPAGAPTAYAAGDHVLFNVSSFSMTGANDIKDTAVVVKSGETVLGSFPLDNAPQAGTAGGFDEVGKAAVDVVLPALPAGAAQLTLVGETTGTEVSVPIQVEASLPASTVSVDDLTIASNGTARIKVTVSGGSTTPTGSVEILEGATSIGTATLNSRGIAVLVVPSGTFTGGDHTLTAVYAGDAGHAPARAEFTLTVNKIQPSVTGQNITQAFGQSKVMRVRLTGLAGFTPTGTVTILEDGAAIAEVAVTGNVVLVPIPAQGLSVGRHPVTVSYSGDANLASATSDARIVITKATSSVTGSVVGTPTINQPVSLAVTVAGSDGVPVTGDVRVSIVGGGSQVVTLVDGGATVNLGGFATTGRKEVSLRYLGSDTVQGSTTTVSFRVGR